MNEFELYSFSLPIVGEVGFMRDKEGLLKHPDRTMKQAHVFFYVKKGHLSVMEDGIDYELDEGNYLFLKKNIPHYGKDHYAKNSEWYYIHFYDPPFEPNVDLDEFSFFQQTILIPESTYYSKLTLPKTQHSQQQHVIEHALNKIISVYESSVPTRALQLSSLVYELFIEIYQSQKTTSNKAQWIVHHLIELLNEKSTTKLTSEEIASSMGMNYAYLSHLFKKETGKSIVQFQNELLIDKAIELFKETTWNVSEVSAALGFSNSFYFSRVFKQVLGVPPSTYISSLYRK